jgi:hypothetical protein
VVPAAAGVREAETGAAWLARGGRGGAADDAGQVTGTTICIPLECCAIAPFHDGSEQISDSTGLSGIGQRVADVLQQQGCHRRRRCRQAAKSLSIINALVWSSA